MSAIPSFEDFIRIHRQRLKYYAARFTLEPNEVENSTYVAWAEAAQKFNKRHPSGASFATVVFATLENILQQDAGRLATVVASDLVSAEVEEVALEGIRYFEVIANNYAAAHATSAEEQLEELLARTYADMAFKDVIRAHRVYGHPTYRKVIDGILVGDTVDTIAAKANCTPRRIYQAITEILRIIRRNDPILDDQLIHLEGDEALAAEPVYIRPVESLHFCVPEDLDRVRVLKIANSMIDMGQLEPVIIDQFRRVLNGVKRLVAAMIIELRSVMTITYPVAEGIESRSEEAYARTRAAMQMQSSAPLKLIPVLLRQLDEGRLSLLVAARLAMLPLQAQTVLVTHLHPALVPALCIGDANALVRAHDRGKLEQTAARLHDRCRKNLLGR